MKRFLALFFIITVLVLTPPSRAYAQETPWIYGGGFVDCIQLALKGGNCAEAWVFANLGNFFPNALNAALIGTTSDEIEKLLKGEQLPYEYRQQMQQRSVLGGTSRAIAMIYSQPPASFGYWLADVGHTLGFSKPAYAQGIGFSGLSALLPVWKAFRNIAYLILAIVMIVIGFMVMLRKKIDPKTVVTVQNALPRIVMTLILITFSYAIVGFLIDLMYLLILLVVAVVGPSVQGVDLSILRAKYTAGGTLGLFDIFQSLSPIAVSGGIGVGVGIIGFFTQGIFTAVLVALLSGLGVALYNDTGGTIGAVSPILLLLLGGSLLITFIRILFMLINSYLQVIISIIFGPLQLMLDAVPGGNGFASWLNNLIVNLLTFPIVAALVMIGESIGIGIENAGGNFWSPPFVPKSPDTSTFIQALIGTGIIMSIPSIVNAMKEALKVKPAIPAGAGVLTQPLGSAFTGVMQIGSQFFYTSQLVSMWQNRGKNKPNLKGDES